MASHSGCSMQLIAVQDESTCELINPGSALQSSRIADHGMDHVCVTCFDILLGVLVCIYNVFLYVDLCIYIYTVRECTLL